MRACNRNSVLYSALARGLALLLSTASAQAGSTPITHGTLELVAENQWIAPGQKFDLGLHFQLEKGWHIYWINPGDSGEPPRVEWQLPQGVTAGVIEWPTPHRLESPTIMDFGYENAVTLIVPMQPDASLAAQHSVQFGASVKLLVCSHEMCIPGKAQLSLALPIKSQPPPSDPRTADLFAGARKSLPLPMPGNWKIKVADRKDSFVLTANIGHQTTQAVFFPLVESQIENTAPQKLVSLASGFQLTLRKSDQLLKPIQRLKGVLTLSTDRAYLIDVPLRKARSSSGTE
ncbi:MAG TPA: protein-disulfide reductase DsbD domain-containing protein [Terriglobales bacterium]|nr:protein-disulfide reductase DsbD domain-containing protein [Terriglobales bacterium]